MDSGKIATLHAGQPHPKPSEPNANLVHRLRELLADAESGRLRNFVGAGIEDDGFTVHTIATGELTRARFTLLGALQHARSLAMRRCFPEDVEAGDL